MQVHGQLVMKGQAALSAAAAAAGGPAAAAGQPGGQPAAAAATAAGGGDVEDDDIFGDAGTDYAPALPQKKEAGGSRCGVCCLACLSCLSTAMSQTGLGLLHTGI